jgi:hypothetical protein
MLIKDEFYVADLLTRHEKVRRDRQRYNVNPANGDQMRYRRTFHPRVFGKRMDIRIPHWGLYPLRKMSFLRHAIPGYRREERRFLRWYERIVDEFASADVQAYERYAEVLTMPETVTGYAEVRKPKMRNVRDRGKQILRGADRAAPTKDPVSP